MAAQTPIPRLSHQSNQMRPKSFLVSCLVILDRLFDLFDRSFPCGSEGIERPCPLVLEVSSSGEKGLETVEFGLVDFASGCSVVGTRLVTLFFFFSFFFLTNSWNRWVCVHNIRCCVLLLFVGFVDFLLELAKTLFVFALDFFLALGFESCGLVL